jgi:hypothetical protein
MTDNQINWRALLAPLGVRAEGVGPMLSPGFRHTSVMPLPFILFTGIGRPQPILGIVDMLSIDGDENALLAAGRMQPVDDLDRPVVAEMILGTLVPGFTVDTTATEDGALISARVVNVFAQPHDMDVWAGRARFTIDQ